VSVEKNIREGFGKIFLERIMMGKKTKALTQILFLNKRNQTFSCLQRLIRSIEVIVVK
jgi:hypothetical protein